MKNVHFFRVSVQIIKNVKLNLPINKCPIESPYQTIPIEQTLRNVIQSTTL